MNELRAIDADAKLIGINNRDLNTFHVDLATTERLAPMIPAGRIVVPKAVSSPHPTSPVLPKRSPRRPDQRA